MSNKQGRMLRNIESTDPIEEIKPDRNSNVKSDRNSNVRSSNNEGIEIKKELRNIEITDPIEEESGIKKLVVVMKKEEK